MSNKVVVCLFFFLKPMFLGTFMKNIHVSFSELTDPGLKRHFPRDDPQEKGPGDTTTKHTVCPRHA